MFLETIVTTVLFEKIRPYLKRKPRNNKRAIEEMRKEMPVFQSVGELKQLLANFSDDVEIRGSSYRYPHLQMYQLDGRGLIFLGSGTQPPKDKS